MASYGGQACAAHDGSLRVIASRLSGRGPPPRFRSFDPTSREEATPSYSPEFMGFYDEEISRVIDAGRAYDGGNPPATMTYDGKTFDNFRKYEAPQTILGVTQKAWFLDKLRTSQATWKVWGNSQGVLDWRIDPQNLPEGIFPKQWPGGYASYGTGDWGTAYHERGEIYDTVRDNGITGFAIVAGGQLQQVVVEGEVGTAI